LEKKIARASAKNPTSRLLDEVPAIGPLIASAMTASFPDPSVFKSASDFSASLGLTPSQHSSGGKEKLGGITKKGNRYLRKMLVVGCTSVLRVAHKYKGVLADWIAAMKAKKPERVVAVALANKLARICWAIMSTGESPPRSPPWRSKALWPEGGRDDEPDGLAFHVSLLWPGAGLARVECFARRRVSVSQGNDIACDRPSPRSDRPLSGC
jgi:hypothetical protein